MTSLIMSNHLGQGKIMTTPGGNTILASFENYLNAAPLPSRVRAGASENTIRGYVHDVGGFLTWWEQTEGEPLTIASLRIDPFSLNKKLIQDYIGYLERTVENATVLRKVASLRAFTRFLQAAKAIDHEPVNGLRLPGKVEPEPRGLSDKQRSRFEAAFQQPWLLGLITKRKRSKGVEENVIADAKNRLVRDRAIVFLMIYAGPRVDETHNLNLGDIELKEKSGTLHIRKGKGFRERYTSIPLPARRALQKWLELREELGINSNKDQPLFVRLRGKPGERLSIRAMQDMTAEAGQRAGIEEPVTPHVLRHTCAFMLRQAGVDIETRAKMLGHSVKTASKYGAPGEGEIEKAASLLDHAEAA
ncbi:MAG: tyrosine-type recombinase/integrase [Chloroflexi bacterium]|nr:tyrosine-type recombinase/integrase [Chloroflexota bacterium]MBI3340789.1 tyrosine-type recombinase/integrase [Chloroflexota bacterium]